MVVLRRSRKPGRYDSICFHAQQCVEKYFKAVLHEAGVPFPKTHDLALLLKLTMPQQPLWSPYEPALKRLTVAAVQFRYPDEWADRKLAQECYETCQRLRLAVRDHLHLA